MGLWWIWNTDDSSFTVKRQTSEKDCSEGQGREARSRLRKRKRNDLKSLRKKKVMVPEIEEREEDLTRK